jgi:fructose-1,6-bisphosphatase/inositol monophosphatase family enzyme
MKLNSLERRCLDRISAGNSYTPRNSQDLEAWLEFSLHSALLAAVRVRDLAHAFEISAELKADGSPATALEREIEDRVRADLGSFAPEARMVGEESGGKMGSSGFSVAVDPIDGTWAFLSQTESHTVTVNVFRDEVPIVGVIANPATGEVAYHGPDGPPRLIRLGFLHQDSAATDLPLQPPREDKILVHLHPNPRGGDLAAGLYRAWSEGEVSMVRSPGGSPAGALVEAAKGHFVYVNRWDRRPAEPWDLVGGVEIVRRAGGEVVDLEGAPIDTLRHSGPFVAGLSERDRSIVCRIARVALEMEA